MSQPPNILFLMSDQHRPDVAGFAGDELVHTPWLDALAGGGVVFDRAYTPAPVCVPGRQCMMAGQLPRTCGAERWGDDLPPGHMTFARRFSQWGYMTVACGKLHHMGADQMQGWRHRIGSNMSVSPRYVEGLQQEIHDRYNPPEQQRWSYAKEVRRAGVGRSHGAVGDDYTVQGALNFIEDTFNSPFYDREQTRPLLLKVSLNLPHYPFLTELDKFNYYLNRVEPFLDQELPEHPVYGQRLVRVGEDVSPREVRRATAAYYGMVETVDEQLGRVLAALEHVGQDLDDWLIVYTSDHGEHLGQRGLWFKHTFFEESVRVPLLIRWPAVLPANRRIDANVSLCDLFATLCELCQLPVPEGLDSRSLVPLMRGDEASAASRHAAGGGAGEDGEAAWPNEVVSHIQAWGIHLMIKRDHLKYQFYDRDMPEVLFDLERDPGETVNVLDAPEYADAMAAFRTRRDALGYGPDA